ncbi:minor capsid protein [Bacillaceae bacterium SIJ1]|uniref:phage minor head protein n=1 Tax=Litoribacterium kuwaitense TaxID=1398745 RepID=UPI0013EB8643|nr:phage minor head protein [Litoribacterium kuwaitense]NGP45978.1 minor capsid protein [Litoribacterium kuwaitense]
MKSFRDLKERLEKLTDRKERDVAKRYALLLKEIQALVSKRYKEYEQDGKLTYTEMAKYNRLKKLEKDIIRAVNSKETGLRNEIHGHLTDQYKESYYRTGYLIETEAEAKASYTTLRDEVIDEAVNTNFTGLTLNDRLSKRRAELIVNMRETIVRGLHEGQTYSKMIKLIQNELEGDRAKAQRIVRTEAHRIREAASLNSATYAEAKGIITIKVWNTVKDERVRERHERLDGVEVNKVDGVFEIDGYTAEAPSQFGVAELDINCRCYLTYRIEKVKRPKNTRAKELAFAEWQKEMIS